MIVRKLFKYEMSHRVDKAYTRRCAYNTHGHSYKLELGFRSNDPDQAMMVVDFSLIKKYIGPFVDSFDHSHMLWTNAGDVEIDFFMENNERWITAPFSSTAEMQAAMFYIYSQYAIDMMRSEKLGKNFNTETTVSFARVHETDTGYAEVNISDLKDAGWYRWFEQCNLSKIVFSPVIMGEWPPYFRKFYNKLIKTHYDTV